MARGFTVVIPSLFGRPGAPATGLAQPASPAPLGRARRADLGLAPGDLASVKAKVRAGCQVLGLRYEDDPATVGVHETLRAKVRWVTPLGDETTSTS